MYVFALESDLCAISHGLQQIINPLIYWEHIEAAKVVWFVVMRALKGIMLTIYMALWATKV